MSILVDFSPEYTANEPVALICNLHCANVSGPLRQPSLIAERGPKSFETRYCEWYHRSSRLPTVLTCSPSVLPSLYKSSVGVKSKQPSHPDDFYLSRISVDYVSPPHTAKSIIRCISKIKELRHCTESHLFTNISRTSPIDGGHVSILTSDRPGSMPENPMVFVTVYELPYPTFTKRMRVTESWSKLTLAWLRNHYTHLFSPPVGMYSDSWLTLTKGEILRTTNDPLDHEFNAPAFGQDICISSF